MNSLEQLNGFGRTQIPFNDDRDYVADQFSGTLTTESIATNEDILFALDPINDLALGNFQSLDETTPEHVTLEIDLSNNEDMSSLNLRYEAQFPTAPKSVEYWKYNRTTADGVTDFKLNSESSLSRSNVFLARYIQTNADFKNIYRSVAIACIDRTDPLTAIARIRYPTTGYIPVEVTNSDVTFNQNGIEIVNTGSYYFNKDIPAYMYADRPLIPNRDNFTIEFYVISALFGDTGSQTMMLMSQGGASGFYIAVNPTGNLVVHLSDGYTLTSTATISPSTWTHIAVVRSNTTASYGGVINVYIDGLEAGSLTLPPNVSQASNTLIGSIATTTGIISLEGGMEEIRVSNIARYTDVFIPATTPHTPDINTLLLLHPNTEDLYLRFDEFESDIPYTIHEKSFTITFTGSDEVENLNITRPYIYGQTQFLFDSPLPSVVDTAVGQKYSIALGTTFGGLLQYGGVQDTVISLLDATKDEINQFLIDVQYVSPGTEQAGDIITWNLGNVTDYPDDYSSASGSFELTATFL